MGVVDLGTNAINHFTQIMGRHVRGHAHGDACSTIDKEIGERCGKNSRFGQTFVVIWDKIDRILVHVVHQGPAKRRHAGFRITHRSGRITFDRSEVTLGINQPVPHRPRLRHMHQSGVNDSLTVGMVIPGGIAADLGALHVLPGGVKPQFMHGVKNPPLGGFKPIPHIRQRARDDDRHRVVEE